MNVYLVHRYDCDYPYLIKATLDKKEAEDAQNLFSDRHDRAIVAVVDTDTPIKTPAWRIVFLADGFVRDAHIDDRFMYYGQDVLNKPTFWSDGVCYVLVQAETEGEAIKLASAIRQKAVEKKEEK